METANNDFGAWLGRGTIKIFDLKCNTNFKDCPVLTPRGLVSTPIEKPFKFPRINTSCGSSEHPVLQLVSD
jgi:hypothetical protein